MALRINNTLFCGIVVAVCFMNYGFGIAYTGPALPQIKKELGYTDFESTLFNVLGLFAGAVGAVIANLLIAKLGKLVTCFFTAMLGVASWVLLSYSSTKATAIIFRILTVTTSGMGSTISPTLMSDIAPPEKKGFYLFMNQLFLTLGFLMVNIFGNFVEWRYLTLVCAFPCLFQAMFVLFIPEPAGLYVKVSFGKVFKYPKQLSISLILYTFLQFSGIQAVLTNLNTIIEAAKITVPTSVVAIAATASQVVTTFVASLLVDKLGLKLCWTISSAGQIIAFLLLWAYAYFKISAAAFLVGLFLEQLTYGIGTGPVPSSKSAQLFNDNIRPSAMGVANAYQWTLGAIVCLIWPTLQALLTIAWSFFFFAAVSAAAVVYGLFVLGPSEKPAGDAENSDDSDDNTIHAYHKKEIPEL